MSDLQDLISFEAGRQLSYRFRFDLLEPDEDDALQYAGEVHPQLVVSMNNDSSAAVKRSMSQFMIPRTEVNDIDYYRMRVRPVMTLGGVEYPMGVFLWADWQRKRVSPTAYDASTSLVDQSLILDQPIASTFSVPTGTNIANAMTSLLSLLPNSILVNAQIDGTPSAVAAPLVYPVSSSNTYLSILTNLAQLGGYYSPYFSNAGKLTIRSVPNILSLVEPDVIIDDHIAANSLGETDNLLDAPNRYIVISNSAGSVATVGEYVVSAGFPHSFAQRGFYVTRVIDMQGVTDTTNAAAIAYAVASQDIAAQSSVTLQTPIDPRHDTFTVVQYRSQIYWEKSWSMQLTGSALMSHALRQGLT